MDAPQRFANGHSSNVTFDMSVGVRALCGQRGSDMSCLWTLFIFLFVCRAIVLTYQEHRGVTYITLNEDPCPRMLIHNKCPIPLLLKEDVRGRKGSCTFWQGVTLITGTLR